MRPEDGSGQRGAPAWQRDRPGVPRGGGLGAARPAAARIGPDPGAVGRVRGPGRGRPVPGQACRGPCATRWRSWPNWTARRRCRAAGGECGPRTRQARSWKQRPPRRRVAAARHEAVLLRRAHLHACPGHGRRRRTGCGCSPSPTERWHRCRGTWPATGMAGSDTLDVDFDDVAAQPVGPPGATWSGPASPRRRRRRRLLVRRRPRGRPHPAGRAQASATCGPHALAHLGAVDIALRTVRTALGQAADEIDADPADLKGVAAGSGPAGASAGRRRGATEVMDRVGRALGAGPLCLDEAHSRRVADLTVYLRQHHAERSLAELGALSRSRERNGEPAGAEPIDAPGTAESAWRAWPGLGQLAVPGRRRVGERRRRRRPSGRRGARGRRHHASLAAGAPGCGW